MVENSFQLSALSWGCGGLGNDGTNSNMGFTSSIAGEIGTVWAEPGALFYILFFLGIASFLLGAVSLALEVRNSDFTES
jgi:hypothetical protein